MRNECVGMLGPVMRGLYWSTVARMLYLKTCTVEVIEILHSFSSGLNHFSDKDLKLAQRLPYSVYYKYVFCTRHINVVPVSSSSSTEVDFRVGRSC